MSMSGVLTAGKVLVLLAKVGLLVGAFLLNAIAMTVVISCAICLAVVGIGLLVGGGIYYLCASPTKPTSAKPNSSTKPSAPPLEALQKESLARYEERNNQNRVPQQKQEQFQRIYPDLSEQEDPEYVDAAFYEPPKYDTQTYKETFPNASALTENEMNENSMVAHNTRYTPSYVTA